MFIKVKVLLRAAFMPLMLLVSRASECGSRISPSSTMEMALKWFKSRDVAALENEKNEVPPWVSPFSTFQVTVMRKEKETIIGECPKALA